MKIVRKFKQLIEYIALFLSMFSVRSKKIMVFGSWFGQKFADNPKYLYLYAVDQGYDAYWITKNKSVYKELRDRGLPVYMDNSVGGIWKCIRAKYVFYCTSVTDVVHWAIGGATIINLWHGVVLKKFNKDDKNNNMYKKKIRIGAFLEKLPYRKRIMLCTSQVQKKIFMRAFEYKDDKVKIWGQPRTDIFFDYERTVIQKRFNGKRIVLYMPTHRNGGECSIDCKKIFDLKRLNTICEKNNYVFLIKKHFYHANEITDTESYSNIFDITSESFDSQELLKSADILISDYSSAYIDYMLLKRPIIFYCYDYEHYLNFDRDMYFDYNDITPGKKIMTYEDLEEVLNKIMGNEQEIDENYIDILNLLFDKSIQGKVCSSILQNILTGDSV